MATERPTRSSSLPHPKRLWIIATIIFFAAAIGPFRFSWFSVCSHCGCIQFSTNRQLPFVPITYWTSNVIEQTLLSRKVATFAQPHEHEWQFGHGGGNGIACAIGPGRHTISSTRSEQIATFIAATQVYRSEPASRHWLSQALDASRCHQLRNWLSWSAFPLDLSTREQYDAWRARADQSLIDFEPLTEFASEDSSRS